MLNVYSLVDVFTLGIVDFAIIAKSSSQMRSDIYIQLVSHAVVGSPQYDVVSKEIFEGVFLRGSKEHDDVFRIFRPEHRLNRSR